MKKFKAQVTILILMMLILFSVMSALFTVSIFTTGSVMPAVKLIEVHHFPDGTSKQFTQWKDAHLIVDPVFVLSYAFLVLVISTAISIILGGMVLRPLEIVEKAVESVNPQDMLPKIIEKGQAEAQITARMINKLSERLQNAMASRMRVVAAAGHDLRTPLTRMRLRAEMLENEEDRRKFTNDIEEMVLIANSAIDLVKEEVGKKDAVEVDMAEVVNDIVHELDMINFHVKIDRLDSAFVKVGPLALKRALNNLIVNACTHGESPVVSVYRDKDKAVCVIEDRGPGIPEDMIAHAFEPFFRADKARTKTTDGAGLGLAIVKEIITRYSGTVTLSNLKPVGLRQEVILPVALPDNSSSNP